MRDATDKADVVFHLAASSRQSGSIEAPESYFSPNVIGTYNVAEACRKTTTRVIFTSTWVVYQKKFDSPPSKYSENSPLAPSNPYAMSKKQGEDWLNLYNALYGEDSMIFRLSNIYGPDDKDRVVPSLIDRAKNGKDIVVFGKERLLNFVHVDDLIDAFILAAMKPKIQNRVLNIGSNECVTLKEVADRIVKFTHSNSRISVAPLPEFEHPYYIPDTSLAEAELGFRAKTSLDAGLQELAGVASHSVISTPAV